jgi:hypothetical protein
MEGMNLMKIYCKHFCKCHNVPPVQFICSYWSINFGDTFLLILNISYSRSWLHHVCPESLNAEHTKPLSLPCLRSLSRLRMEIPGCETESYQNRLGWKIRAGKVTLGWGSLSCHSNKLRNSRVKDVITCWKHTFSTHCCLYKKKKVLVHMLLPGVAWVNEAS